MDGSLKYDRQMRSLTVAMGTAMFVAVGAMFIPATILESVTAIFGLSGTISATDAPSGDIACALIAFGAGALTLIVMAAVLLRSDKRPFARIFEDVPAEPVYEDHGEIAPGVSDRFARFKSPNTEFADLPKLRGNDVHPDAPPRRPLSATSDLPVLDLVEAALPAASSPITQLPDDNQPLIADMVAQLEAGVAERQAQLNELEAVAARLALSQLVAPEALPELSAVADIEPTRKIMPEFRPARAPLEAVPTIPAQQDDMDEALSAALATLYRMNESSGATR